MRRLLIILLASVLLAPSVSMAAPKCKAKRNHTVKYDTRKRLCVYQKCKVKSGHTLSVNSNKCTYTKKENLGDWKYQVTPNPITGVPRFRAYLFGRGFGSQTINIVCSPGNSVSFYIDFDTFLSLNNITIRQRTTSGSASNYVDYVAWDPSNDGHAAFFPFFYQTWTYLKALSTWQVVTFESSRFADNPVYATFDLAGMSLILEKAKITCPDIRQDCPFGEAASECRKNYFNR